MDLIFDRTKTDVLLGTEKGSYGAADLNRVERAVAELAELAKAVGLTKQFGIKTDWGLPGVFDSSLWPTKEQMARYLNNVIDLCDAVELKAQLPSSMEHLTWEGANQIEQSLTLVYERIQRIVKIFRYSGEIFAGEENGL
ncbi:MAG: hypothetical protein IKT52_08530 [Oscillospiraceae bacterium]|nr:hypothetical protein [Oscillospiraceae bacterium]